MIHVVDQPYFIPRNEVDEQFEGKFVLLAYNSEDTERCLVAAYSDGNPENEDKDYEYLFEVLRNQYNGNGIIVFGYVHDGSELVCI